MKKYLRT